MSDDEADPGTPLLASAPGAAAAEELQPFDDAARASYRGASGSLPPTPHDSADAQHPFGVPPAVAVAVDVDSGKAAAGDGQDVLSEYGRVAAFHCLLLLGYGVTRLACTLGLPDDAADTSDGGTVAADLYHILVMGAVLAYLTGLHTAARFRWFWRRPQYALIFLATCPVFAAVGLIPGLQVSLATIAQWGPLAWIVMLCCAFAIAAVVAWHARHALRALPRRERLAYLASRLAVCFAFFGMWFLYKVSRPGRKGFEEMHLHHWAIGFLIAIWGAFNHPLSATLLAVGTGIFVQGVGAYHYAWLFNITAAGEAANAAAAGCVLFKGNASAISCGWDTAGNGSTWGIIMCPWDWPSGDARPNGTCGVAHHAPYPPPPRPPAVAPPPRPPSPPPSPPPV